MNINDTLKYLIAVIIYGTNGFFVRFINCSSEFIVLCRGLIGSMFILSIMFMLKDLPDITSIKNNFKMLFISGIALGLNWIFLFAGYKYAISITSLCNYTAPIIVVIISSFVYKEKLSIKQCLCVLFAFIGIVLLSGLLDGHINGNIHCFIYGFLAAAGFVVLVFCNRKMHDIKPLDKTVIQLFISFLTVLPFVIVKSGFPSDIDITSILILIMMGVINTGLAYIFYFNSIDKLPVHKVAIIGYIEPVLSILIGALVFNEQLSIFGIIGTILILGSALFNELFNISK